MPRVPPSPTGSLDAPSPVWVGIDPGASGGIAAIKDGELAFWKMPESERDLWELFRTIGSSWGPSFAVIEKVGGFVKKRRGEGGDGEDRQPGSAMFKFGQGYGSLRMGMVAAGIPFDEVPPQRWQKLLGVGIKGAQTKSQWKNRLRAKAQQLFPKSEKIILDVADAILIAHFCRSTQIVPKAPATIVDIW